VFRLIGRREGWEKGGWKRGRGEMKTDIGIQGAFTSRQRGVYSL
jgi:hypothetical protein